MEHEPTEGEKIIGFFLDDEGIKFRRYEKIYNLEDDSKDHREADFYLPKYKVYLEFEGQWNNEKDKERYKEKKVVYKKNNIPCIYIYPDNLATLKYLFYMRLKGIFKEYPTKLKFEFFKYRLSMCSKAIGWIWLGFLVLVLLLANLNNLLQSNFVIKPYITLLILLAFIASIVLTIWVTKKIFSKK